MELAGAGEALENAQALLQAFRAKGLPVVHVQHIALQEEADFFRPDTPGAAIHPPLTPLPGEKVMVKNFPNSFRETRLLEVLRENQVTNLVICGMMTDVCVAATVRASMDLGFKNTLIGDAVATRDRELNGAVVTAEEINRAFLAGLAALGGLYATVTSGAQFLRHLQDEQVPGIR